MSRLLSRIRSAMGGAPVGRESSIAKNVNFDSAVPPECHSIQRVHPASFSPTPLPRPRRHSFDDGCSGEASLEGYIEELWHIVTEGEGELTRDRYIAYHGCMFRALRLEFNDRDALAKATRDFLADSKGSGCGLPAVPKERFVVMMRTLAERWTAVEGRVQRHESARFLRTLLLSITHPAGDGERALRHPSDVHLGVCIPSCRRAAAEAQRPAPEPAPAPARRRRRSLSEATDAPAAAAAELRRARSEGERPPGADSAALRRFAVLNWAKRSMQQ